MENTQKPIKATLDSSDDSVKTQKPILIQLDDIPTPTDADAGKVLGVDDEGKYELTEGGGGGSDFSSIQGKGIELTVRDNVITSVEVNRVSITPSDFFAAPYVDILLTLSHITIFGLTIEGLTNVPVYFTNGTAVFNSGEIFLQGLFTYTTPDGTGLGYGIFSIGEGLTVDFIEDSIFISP